MQTPTRLYDALNPRKGKGSYRSARTLWRVCPFASRGITANPTVRRLPNGIPTKRGCPIITYSQFSSVQFST